MMKVKALVLTGFGLNCDSETAYALKLAGAQAEKVHINDLVNKNVSIKDYKILVFGGGFSWGDEHGAGVLQAVRMKTHLGEDIQRFIEKDNLILGICNGFQTLVNFGLLPGFDIKSMERKVAVINNEHGNFIDDWVNLSVNGLSKSVFTKDINHLELPVRHGEGLFYTDDETLEKIETNNQAVLRYSLKDYSPAKGNYPFNPNGSLNDIAGICDSTGRVFGLMPHPEAFVRWTQHPHWSVMKHKMEKEGRDLFSSSVPEGLKIFQNAVNYFS